MRDIAEYIEMNRFVGREFLLWLWFESELYETNFSPSSGKSCALWLETQITLSLEGDEARIKGPGAASSPEAKQALRQGKLPREARLRAVIDEHEFAWVLKADELATGGLAVPAQLKADKDKYEALYERMLLTEELTAVMEALFRDFVALRLATDWETVVVPAMKRWAAQKPVDVEPYEASKKRLLTKKSKKKS